MNKPRVRALFYRLFPAAILGIAIAVYIFLIPPNNLYLIFVLNILLSVFVFFLSRVVLPRKIGFVLSAFTLLILSLAGFGMLTITILILSLGLLLGTVYLFR